MSNMMFYGHNTPSGAYLKIISATNPVRDFTDSYSLTVTLGCFDTNDEITPIVNPISFYPSVRVDNNNGSGAYGIYASSIWNTGTTTFNLLVIVNDVINVNSFNIDIYLTSGSAPVSYRYHGTITTKTVPAG